ncbi:1,4-dihydroxy-2-naphthoate polyprenyltransferase [Longibacter salinarum]|uniref:1,4-dihydroxy-2-naphthoate octaprenyltransferase n=1 Tax=Longibacter salinarum TaxID=1850348 RepID=A0A2A8D2Y4_9BACT|nr:1,4-dihydroxy-2-naphthoate polyprenyltransferase [Longibacter salinarum]PEN15305.1 1,4-dihydroxy-2-naphthoate polyprenyltransferase [Longibacter salinarum]
MQTSRARPTVWIQAARPKTLGAAIAPVLVGTAMALEAGSLHLLSATCALISAILIQVGVNFHNDYHDYLKGTDTEERVGPERVTQAGLVDPETMRFATIAVFAVAVLAGLYLIWRGGWPILAIGIASILSALWYTGGRYSLAYMGAADLFVFVFFGPVAVGGTYYVQALSVSWEVLFAGAGPGLLAVAILLVNNIRDVEGDRNARKRTLVVRLGRRVGVYFYAICLLLAFGIPAILYAVTGAHPWAMVAMVALPLAIQPVRILQATTDPRKLNPLLGATGRLLVLWALLFSIGWNI